MKNLINTYVEKLSVETQKRDQNLEQIGKYEQKIENYKKKIEKLNKQRERFYSVSWIDEIIHPLAQQLAMRMNKKYDIYGPFGLGCRTSIYLFDDENKSITDQDTWSITLLPDDLRNGIIRYETGEMKKEYASGTIGEMNGFNNITADVPDTIEEIEKLLRYSGKSRCEING